MFIDTNVLVRARFTAAPAMMAVTVGNAGAALDVGLLAVE